MTCWRLAFIVAAVRGGTVKIGRTCLSRTLPTKVQLAVAVTACQVCWTFRGCAASLAYTSKIADFLLARQIPAAVIFRTLVALRFELATFVGIALKFLATTAESIQTATAISLTILGVGAGLALSRFSAGVFIAWNAVRAVFVCCTLVDAFACEAFSIASEPMSTFGQAVTRLPALLFTNNGVAIPFETCFSKISIAGEGVATCANLQTALLELVAKADLVLRAIGIFFAGPDCRATDTLHFVSLVSLNKE